MYVQVIVDTRKRAFDNIAAKRPLELIRTQICWSRKYRESSELVRSKPWSPSLKMALIVMLSFFKDIDTYIAKISLKRHKARKLRSEVRWSEQTGNRVTG
eukprot:Gregarina_sp_Poly_1__10555@NODE_781_length_6314_cov_28_558028_g573_i0_p7_GENE_NODE_781_length_6314_cov_28_558028_g573_i0NODE_781_length_6314_cov_28_558028_g573_i0_p7_ORF_typecomplete_len100_score5_03_NODE_781_length_6314_cov_28_558028_g573_i010531352